MWQQIFKAKLFVGVSRPTFSHSEKSFHFISDLMSFWQDEAEPSMISEWRRITSVCELNVSVNSSMDLKFASFPCCSEKRRLAPPRYISALISALRNMQHVQHWRIKVNVWCKKRGWYSCYIHHWLVTSIPGLNCFTTMQCRRYLINASV